MLMKVWLREQKSQRFLEVHKDEDSEESVEFRIKKLTFLCNFGFCDVMDTWKCITCVWFINENEFVNGFLN